MKKLQETTMYGFPNPIGGREAQGLALCFKAYSELPTEEYIMDGGIGYNDKTDNVYIALENGVQIVSGLGQEVRYLVTDFYSSKEFFVKTYEEALIRIELLRQHDERTNNFYSDVTK